MNDMTPIPSDFEIDDEHPLVRVAFAVTFEGSHLAGDRMSMTHLTATPRGATPAPGSRGIALVRIDFPTFALTIAPEVVVRGVDADGLVTFTFVDPTGPHLPQLRYVLNATIAGEVASMDGLMAYSGPTSPKPPKADHKVTLRERIRSIGVIAMSVGLIGVAAVTVTQRLTTGHEMHPVFVEAKGLDLRATAGGQVTYLDVDAQMGEVVFALTTNAGDVLNVQMPCECQVALAPGAFVGSTVLPEDLILTAFDADPEIGARMLMSIEGASRALAGDEVRLELNDGRTMPVEITMNSQTQSDLLAGELFVPVTLTAVDGALTTEDLGAVGHVSLRSPIFGLF